MRGFLALGDSYTIGEGVADSERWPSRLTELLARAHPIGEPEVIARTAWTTDELADAITAASPAGPFPLVTLMIGVNDQYRARPIEGFATEFAGLLETAVSLAAGPGRVVAISIPDWGATPFAAGRDTAGISREIDRFNSAARSIAADRGASWIDVTVSSREMGSDASLVAEDGLHPSGVMHARWARLIEPAALRALSSARA